MKVSERVHALAEKAASDESTVSWPAQLALGRLADRHLRRAVEAVEQDGHWGHESPCPLCSMLLELNHELDTVEFGPPDVRVARVTGDADLGRKVAE